MALYPPSSDGLVDMNTNGLLIPETANVGSVVRSENGFIWEEVVDMQENIADGSFSALPRGGYYVVQKPIRAYKEVAPSLQTQYRRVIKQFNARGLKLPRSALESSYPLPSLQNRRSQEHIGGTPYKLYQLPTELTLEILKIAMQSEWNGILFLLSSARVCLTYASIIRFAVDLWAMAFKSATTDAQRFIVKLLSGNRALHLPCSGPLQPKDLSEYMDEAGVIDLDEIEDAEDWIEFLRECPLPRLRHFVCVYHTTDLTLDAAQLLSLSIGGPISVFNGANLLRVHLRMGFAYHSDIATELPAFLSSCTQLRELHIESRSGTSGSCWQDLLRPLSTSHLRRLRLDDYDGYSADRVHDELHLLYLEVLITCSVLLVNAPHAIHVELSPRSFADLRAMASRFSNTQYLGITMCDGYFWPPPTNRDTVEGDIFFHDLRVLECNSSVDRVNASFVRFLATSVFQRAPTLRISLDLGSWTIDVPSSGSGGFCETHEHVQRVPPNDDRSMALDGLRSIMEESLVPGAKLKVEANMAVGGDPSFVFSVNNREMYTLPDGVYRRHFADMRLHVSMNTRHCACTAREGFPVTPACALSALAMENAEELHISLRIDVPGYTHGAYNGHEAPPYYTESRDVDAFGMSFATWTPPDALATPNPTEFARLRRDVSRLKSLKKLIIEISRSSELRGHGFLKALIELNNNELLRDCPVTCAQLQEIIFEAPEDQRRKSVRYRDTLKDEIWKLAAVRGALAKQGRCGITLFSFGRNFCFCRTPERDMAFLRAIEALGVVVNVSRPEDGTGCKRCT